MNTQLYTAASGLLVEERRLEMVSNNLANLGTTGYRPQRTFATLYETLSGAPAGGELRAANRAVALAGAFELPGPGQLRPTGRALDVAVGSDALFTVETPGGRRYTRDGSFSIDDGGRLVDNAGHNVLDVDGKPIQGLTPQASIGADGRVSDVGGELATLAVVRDPGGVLRLEGGNLYTAGGADAELETLDEPGLHPATLESSAVQALGELVQLVDAQRAFEGYQKLITMTMYDVNRRTVNDIAG